MCSRTCPKNAWCSLNLPELWPWQNGDFDHVEATAGALAPRVGKEYGNSRYNLLPGWGEKNPVRQESERIRTRLCLYALIAGVKLMKIADSAQSVANPLALLRKCKKCKATK
jgi:hypothetical protein